MNLNQLTIPSRDLAKSIPFYQQLGLQLIVDSAPRYARFVCPDGATSFSIHHVDTLPTGEGIAIYFECEALDATVNALKAAGIHFDEDPTDQPWLWREARLKDLDGTALYFIQPKW